MSQPTPTQPKRTINPAVIVVVVLLVLVSGFFLLELFTVDTTAEGFEEVSETAYREEVDALLAIAQPENGEPLLQTYGCTACHVIGAANNIAPPFEGLMERAAERRPPMPADAYVYESIIHPGVYVVEGYPNSMVANFEERVTEQELADILAYLLEQ